MQILYSLRLGRLSHCPKTAESVSFMKKINELSLIRLVTVINFVFGLAGIVFAVLARSRSVLFDALYSFIASFFTLISARVVRLVISGEDRDYQFGYGSFEPFFIVIRTVFILLMNVMMAFFAVRTILDGGNTVNVSVAILYTLLSIITCAVIAGVLRGAARKNDSPVLAAEAKSWLNDTLLSSAVLAAFAGIILLRSTPLAFLIPYIDPAITLVFIAVMIPSLAIQFFVNMRELLVAAPPVELQEELDAIIEPYIAANNFSDFQTYSTKRGRNLYVVVHIYMKKDASVKELDKIRKAIVRDIRNFWHYSDIDIVFTLDTSWIPLSFPQGEDVDCMSGVQAL